MKKETDLKKETATYKDGAKVVPFNYTISNPLETWADFENAFGGQKNAIEKCAKLCDYHGTKCAARNEARDIAELPANEKKTATELKELFNSANIIVTHGASQRGPSKQDLEKATALAERCKKEPNLIAQLTDIAKTISHPVPDGWAADAIADLRQARRAWLKKQDPMA